MSECFSDHFTEPKPFSTPKVGKPWKVMALDDDVSILKSTQMALEEFNFCQRNIELHTFEQVAEGQKFIKENPDTAVIFLDVVMEEVDSGLKFIKYVRETLDNKRTRIILRTGQPWKAPEVDTMEKYDLTDYTTKTHLDENTLHHMLRNSLKSYQEIMVMAHHQDALGTINQLKELLMIPDQSRPSGLAFPSHSNKILKLLLEMLYQESEDRECISGVVAFILKDPITHRVNIPKQGVITHFKRITRFPFYILSRAGQYKKHSQSIDFPENILSLMQQSCNEKKSIYDKDHCVIFNNCIESQNAIGIMLIYLEHGRELTTAQQQLSENFLYHLWMSYQSYWRIFSAIR